MIIIYTTATCPRCQVLKTKLAQKGIPYEEFTDEDKMIEMGIQTVPIMSVDGRLMDFSEANQFINNYQAEEIAK